MRSFHTVLPETFVYYWLVIILLCCFIYVVLKYGEARVTARDMRLVKLYTAAGVHDLES